MTDTAMTDIEMQILRTVDKVDKIGVCGVIDLLQKPAEQFGAGLDPVRAELVGSFLTARGATNGQTLENLRAWFPRADLVTRRVKLLVLLEDMEGETALDRLLSLRPNDDQTWANDGRPANIAWALDDLAHAMTCAHAALAQNGGA